MSSRRWWICTHPSWSRHQLQFRLMRVHLEGAEGTIVGSPTAGLTAAVSAAYDNQRCGFSRSEFDHRSTHSLLNHATWLTDLLRSGKLLNEFADSKASRSSDWVASLSLMCLPDLGSYRMAKRKRRFEFNTKSQTTSGLRPLGTHQDFVASSG